MSISRLHIALFSLLLIVACGVIGYRSLEGYTWTEALYMTVITLSTVGYREVRPLGATGQLFTAGSIIETFVVMNCPSVRNIRLTGSLAVDGSVSWNGRPQAD